MANYSITMKQLNSSGTYDTLYPATIGSQVSGITAEQISGIYTAEQTLTDATAALFQLSGDTALPDKVFEILSKAALVGTDGGLITPGGDPVKQIQTISGSYVGNGNYTTGRTITFPFKPMFVAIAPSGESPGYIFMRPHKWNMYENFNQPSIKQWKANGIVLYPHDGGWSYLSLNTSGVTYNYFAVS